MAEKSVDRFRTSKIGQMTIGKLRRDRGYGEYRLFIEDMFAEMKEDKLTPAEMHERLTERLGHQFISRSHFYRLCAYMEENPKTAIRDLRSVNSGRKKDKLSDSQNYAMSLILAHDRLYKSGILEARDEVITFSGEFGLQPTDVPPAWRCYETRKKQTVIERHALENNHKEVWKLVGGYTEHPRYAPDDQHNFDEGKHSVKFQVQDRNKRVRITISLQVDRGTFIFRMPHVSYGEFNERESILALKTSLLSAPAIDLPYCCIPKQIRCDNATFHSGPSFSFADHWLRNRSGRTGRIVYNPVAQPQANPSAERGIGETKRKFLRKFLKDFLLFLEEDEEFQRPTLPGAVAHLNDLKRLLIAFVRKHNQRLVKGTAIPRLQKYLLQSPEDSKSVTVEEINKNVLFVQKMRLEPSGVKIDGYRYDGGVHSRYKQRDDTYIGVMPEGNSTFAVLFVMDPETKELLRVGELGRPDLKEISPAKQKQFIGEFTTASQKNTAEVNHLKQGLRRGKAKERAAAHQEQARLEAAEAERKEAAAAAAKAAESPKEDVPTAETPAPEIEKPVRPHVEILKAA
jgi:hypothetical protein